jgi:hypothetical protein
MESKKINQLATELAPDLSDITIIGDPTTGISKKITLSQMASLFTGTVEEYANLAAFPLVGVADTIYIALDTNILYRWNTGTSAYVELSPNIVSSLVFNDANGFDGTINLVGSVATLTITTALTTGSVGFIGASGALLQDNANFFWDDTNNRLGLGTNAPTTALDVFGSGIIGRINATSTNNAYLGFASAGTNKWSIGNVQSDHRFRIFSETNTSELVSVLQTGEFGIGIANPTTKLHIDGAATALIANLDANVSVAKSISFRSDNSNRINLEVSGTESGSNAGANFFLRTYTDLGALIETPFQIIRSTGVTTIKSLTLTNALSISNGGTGSTTQNFVDLTTTQSIGGAKTFTSALSGTSGTFIVDDSATNSVLDILTLTHTTSGTAASGLGAGILFRAERPSGGIVLSRGAIYGISGTDADDDGDLAFYTLTSTGGGGFNEKMRLTSNGLLGIGNLNPQAFVTSSGFGNLVVGNGSGETGITIYSGTTGSSGLMFADATSGSGAYTGYLVYRHATDQLEIATGGGTPRLTIASTGNITTEALFSPTRQSNKNYTGSYGVIVVGSGNVSSYTFNLQTVFPEMAINGNVVAVYGKYVIFRGAQGESGQFGMCRATNNVWTAGSFSNQTATGAYSLSSVTGSVNSLTFTFNTNIYFVCEITCMIS